MSSTFDEYGDTDQNDTDQDGFDQNPLRKQMRRLEQQNKKLTADQEAGLKAIRTLEFVKAGIDVNDPKARYFVNGYDGDLNVEAIKTAATDAGFLGAPAPVEPVVPQQELNALRDMAQAPADATPDGGRDWDAEYASAPTREAFHAIVRERYGPDAVKFD